VSEYTEHVWYQGSILSTQMLPYRALKGMYTCLLCNDQRSGYQYIVQYDMSRILSIRCITTCMCTHYAVYDDTHLYTNYQVERHSSTVSLYGHIPGHSHIVLTEYQVHHPYRALDNSVVVLCV